MQIKTKFSIYFLPIFTTILNVYLWEKITLPYSNPEEVIGYYSFFSHSHFTDTIRYIVFVGAPLILFFVLFIFLNKQECLKFNEIFPNASFRKNEKNFQLNLIFYICLFVLIAKFFSTGFSKNDLDIFHEGQLLSGAYNFFLTKEIWKNTYVISGLFMDILNANLAWSITGNESIGSYRFFIFFLQSFTSIIFLILGYYICKSFNLKKDEEVLFFLILSIVFIYLVNSNVLVFRDLPLACLLIFCLNIFRSHKSNLAICFLLGTLSIISLLWSLDRGMYLNATLISFIILLFFMKRNYQIFYIFLGILFSWILFYLLIGKGNFSLFIDHSFTILKYMDLQQGVIYPAPFSDEPNATRGTRNLLLIIINGFFVIFTLLNRKSDIPKETKLFLVVLFVLSFLFYKSGLSRSDAPHMKQAISFHTILFIIIIYFNASNYLKKYINSNGLKFLFEKKITLILFLAIFLQNNISFQHVKNIFNFKERYIKFININDAFFLKENDRKIVNKLKELTKNEDCFQLFNYHTAYTYLIKKKTCSKFTHIFNLGPKKHQYDFIDDIKQTNPKFILYETTHESETLINYNDKKSLFLVYSFVRPSEKFPYINKFILENYKTLEEFNDWVILHRN